MPAISTLPAILPPPADLLQNNAREWLRRLLISGLWLWFSAGAFPQALERTLVPEPVLAQQQTAPSTTIAALFSLSSRSAVAFTGRIVKIERTGDVVDVTFLIDTPLVGSTGSTYTVREWAGLSPMGQSHYTLGERAAIFLHAPGPSGLSSPVDGQDGIVPVVQASADQPALLDLRRLATRVQRSLNQPLPDAQTSAITIADARTLVSRNRRTTFVPILRRLPIVIAPPVEVRVGTVLPSGTVRDDLIFAAPSSGMVLQ
jgi:hypothetical protein